MAAESARQALRIAVGLDDGLLIAASTAALAFYEAARGRKIEFDDTRLDEIDAAAAQPAWADQPGNLGRIATAMGRRSRRGP